jgi:hypothetical protein
MISLVWSLTIIRLLFIVSLKCLFKLDLTHLSPDPEIRLERSQHFRKLLDALIICLADMFVLLLVNVTNVGKA